MTQNLVNEVQKSSPKVLKKNTIQGLFKAKTASESFWFLKAKVELSTFQDQQKWRNIK